MNKLIPKLSVSLINKILLDKFGTELVMNKTFSQMGLDDLDEIELLMEIEKELNIAIDDSSWEEFVSKPVSDWRSDFREQKINKILE